MRRLFFMPTFSVGALLSLLPRPFTLIYDGISSKTQLFNTLCEVISEINTLGPDHPNFYFPVYYLPWQEQSLFMAVLLPSQHESFAPYINDFHDPLKGVRFIAFDGSTKVLPFSKQKPFWGVAPLV